MTEIDIEQLPTREKAEKPTIYIAGDSTAQTYNYTKVYPQTGWGQVFADYFNDDIIIENRAMGGRSSKSYDNDGQRDDSPESIRKFSSSLLGNRSYTLPYGSFFIAPYKRKNQ